MAIRTSAIASPIAAWEGILARLRSGGIKQEKGDRKMEKENGKEREIR